MTRPATATAARSSSSLGPRRPLLDTERQIVTDAVQRFADEQCAALVAKGATEGEVVQFQAANRAAMEEALARALDLAGSFLDRANASTEGFSG